MSRKFCKGAYTPDLQAAPSLQAGVVARAGAWSRSQETSREIAILVRGTGASFLEAPVLWSRRPAAEGTLVILTGGDEEVSRRMEPLLLAMGSKVIHMGETGMAAHMKLIINQIMGTVLCVFAEAALTGVEAGLPAGKILEVIDSSVVSCPAIRTKGPDMLGERVFTPNFPLKHAHKVMRLAVEAGKAAGVPTPVTKAACDLFAAARDRGVLDLPYLSTAPAIPLRPDRLLFPQVVIDRIGILAERVRSQQRLDCSMVRHVCPGAAARVDSRDRTGVSVRSVETG